ncbi:response regulator transcription factor [Shewanella vesiculosa]|uniref:response regulator transcription factor n=1 Tax=Shewanella vesiculosa TaxID=518738 RepID=UPI001E021958|nr:LuxR C-terminal-related transcriptional regulator [Shewanella vesiculosa]NCQ40297.1 response regulator transcription factor [Shewanella vesiculosa]
MSKIILTKKVRPTQRQYEVLILRVIGLKYTEIEKRLSISQSSVKKHLTQLMVKLNCFSQTELVDFAKSSGWIDARFKPTGEVEYRIRPYEQVGALRILKHLN